MGRGLGSANREVGRCKWDSWQSMMTMEKEISGDTLGTSCAKLFPPRFSVYYEVCTAALCLFEADLKGSIVLRTAL